MGGISWDEKGDEGLEAKGWLGVKMEDSEAVLRKWIGVLGKRPGRGWCLTCPCALAAAALTSDLAVGLNDPAPRGAQDRGTGPWGLDRKESGGPWGRSLEQEDGYWPPGSHEGTI